LTFDIHGRTTLSTNPTGKPLVDTTCGTPLNPPPLPSLPPLTQKKEAWQKCRGRYSLLTALRHSFTYWYLPSVKPTIFYPFNLPAGSNADPLPHDFGLLDSHPESAFQMRIPDADADPAT
jgi:hypothetical protein